MSQRKEKTPEQVLDENFKIASTRAAEKHLNKRQESMDYWRNYQLPEEKIRE